jgi:Tol biopolymer transport system component
MDGNDNIFVIDVDGSNRIRITNNPADDSVPDWSPNGDAIAFQSHRNGSWDIYTVNTRTFAETQLTHSPSDFREPSWSPDGTKLALCETPVGEIYVMNADGTGLMNITNSGTYETSPDW